MNDPNEKEDSGMSYFIVNLETTEGKAILPLAVRPQETFLESLKDSLSFIHVKAIPVGSIKINKTKYDELYFLSIT